MLMQLSKGTLMFLYIFAALGFMVGFVDANAADGKLEVWQEDGELHIDNGTTVETVNVDYSQSEQYRNETLPEKAVIESTAQPILNLYSFSVLLGTDYGNATQKLPNALLAALMFVVPIGPPSYFIGRALWRWKKE